MPHQFSKSARLLGITASAVILLIGLAYAITLGLGFASLTSPDQQIGNPYFTLLEALILVLAPSMVTLMVAVHAWAAPEKRAFSLMSVCLMVMLAIETCCVHFVILTLSGQPGFVGKSELALFLAFQWPSVVYSLDILGWDIFFALSMLFAAPAFLGAGIYRAIRIAMIASAVLALAGLGGLALSDMSLRNIGIAGYLLVFMVVDALLLVLFVHTGSAAEPKSGEVTDCRGLRDQA